MQIGSRRMRFAVAMAIAWLVVAALAVRGNVMRAATASASPANAKTAPRGVFQPACATSTLYAQTAAARAAAPPSSQMSEEAFKNVQLLKGIPVDEFMGTIGLFSAALGMCCLECHITAWKFV